MSARRTEYQIVGRYMDGKEVVAYHLLSLDTGKKGRYTKEQVYYLVGRGQITNCDGQLYQDKVLLRGKGMSLEDLPVVQVNGDLSRTEAIGRVKRGTSAEEALNQVMIVGKIVDGRRTLGYVVRNAGGGEKRLKRDDVLQLARDGKIGNARAQYYNGQLILKGVNCDLSQLPQVK